MTLVRIDARLLRSWPLPRLDGEQGKRDRGCVLVVGGSCEIPGAVVLSAVAAMRAGAGTVQIATAAATASAVAVTVPEARVVSLPTDRSGELATRSGRRILPLLDGCDVLLVGPGMRDGGLAKRVLGRRSEAVAPRVVIADAGALEELEPQAHRQTLVITPHAGEAAQLLDMTRGAIERDPERAASRLATELRAVVVLKGVRTIVADRSGRRFENVAGNLGLGVSGSGDVLAGIIAGLCARRARPLQAAVWGVHAHAKAGDALARRIGPLGYLAREVSDEVPALLAAWSRRRSRQP